MPYDVGDQVPLAVTVKDATGALADAGAMTLVVTAPDGTTSSPSITHSGTGAYSATYAPTQLGQHRVAWTATGTNASAFTDAFSVDGQTGIVSLAAVRAHLGITSTVTDERLREHLLLASEMCESYTRRTYRQTTVTELHDGGTDTILLRRSPVQSVTSVTVSGGLVAAADWTADLTGCLIRRNTSSGSAYWVGGNQNVSVVYVAGATSVPWKVRQACLELVRHLWDSQRGGYSIPKQQGAGDDWDPRQGYSVPRRVAELLDFDIGPGF